VRGLSEPFHATEGHKTLGKGYTSLLNAYANPIGHDGNLDLVRNREKLEQRRPIDQFMV
jgi:hypothetical protein